MSQTVTAQSTVAAPTERVITFAKAINEGIDASMAADQSVYLMGLGVPDPKSIFGTTAGLQAKYGSERVFDMPTAENGMTGIAVGSALNGMRPIMVHQRIDFALLAMEQIANQAANWHYAYGGVNTVPMVIRLIVGRGWGQGPQHSQALHAWFAHLPGLKVVAPATAYDAKGLMIAAVKDNNPVIFLEHRWCHNTTADVPSDAYEVPLGKSRVARQGKDVTIVAVSHMVLEAVRAAETLHQMLGISAEVVDLRTIRPLDMDTILSSVDKTGRLVVADTAWTQFGISAEIVAAVVESEVPLKSAPKRIGLPGCPSPCSPGLSKFFYPDWQDIGEVCAKMLKQTWQRKPAPQHADIPDSSFTGPF